MRSKRYLKLAEKIDRKKSYSPAEAIGLVKETGKTKFDSSVEVHIRLGIDPKKGEQAVKGNVVMPHGTGKTLRVAVFTENDAAAKKAGADVIGGESLIKEIKTKGAVDFDVVLAVPEMMKSMAGVAKILGPKGLMPSPKAGTVVKESELAKAIDEIKKGKVNFRNDDTGNIHQLIGKVSWEEKKLEENLLKFVDAVSKAKPAAVKSDFIKAIYMTSTMGPAVKVGV